MVTRKDVAQLAGVSVTAVSRVMNNSGYVAKEKRKAILKAVKKLGYRPSPVAVSLQQKLTKQILFYCKDLGNAFNMETYRGMIHYAAQFDYMVVLSGTWDTERIKTMLIDGVVLPNESVAVEYLRAIRNTLPVPTVSASYGSPTIHPRRIPLVESDTYEAIELIIDHLLEKGHRKIAFASPYPLTVEHPRGIAYRSKMHAILGDRVDDYAFISDTAPKSFPSEEEDFFEYGEQIAHKIHHSKLEITAVINFNDDMALGMMRYFHREGIRVPEDISVVGIDGIKVGSYIHPRLTTVDLSPFTQGMECARVLLDMIAGKKVKSRTVVPVRVIEGGSVLDLTNSP